MRLGGGVGIVSSPDLARGLEECGAEEVAIGNGAEVAVEEHLVYLGKVQLHLLRVCVWRR